MSLSNPDNSNGRIIAFLKLMESTSLVFYLPNLQSLKTGEKSFYQTTTLSLSSNSIIFYFSLYLPNLQSFITGYESFDKTTSLSLSGRIFLFLFM